jgi:hypothetical protein
MKKTMRPVLSLCAALALISVGGCRRSANTGASTGAPPAHKHEHHPPHGGTPLKIGDEVYHIELVLDPDQGLLSAYVLDGEMESFIRCAELSWRVSAKTAGGDRELVFKPIANSATGETEGDSSLFQAQADWLKNTPEFGAMLRSITIRGTTFKDVAFNFPRGNDTD